MDLWHAVVLGLVQGITEYIPVSSKTHLILVPYLLGWPAPSLAFNILIQLGTLFGVFVYFWRDLLAIVQAVLRGVRERNLLIDEDAKTGWLVVLATLPAVVFGLLFKSKVEALLQHPQLAMGLLLVTAVWLVAAEKAGTQDSEKSTVGTALAMGFAQVGALFPGISRSGSTIGAGLFAGLSRPAAARFSFLMSIPVMLGASVIGIKDLLKNPGQMSAEALPILVGALVAGVSGYLVIRWLLGFVKNRPLSWFSIYCVAVAIGGLSYDILVRGN